VAESRALWRCASRASRLQRAGREASIFARGLVFGSPLIDEIRKRGGAHPEEIVEAYRRS
jgi:hypothetical protein